MSKHSRAGGKFTGNHNTLIEQAALVADYAVQSSLCYKVSPGLIKGGLRSVSGKFRVKFTTLDNGNIKAEVRGNNAKQIVHLYTDNAENLVKALLPRLEEKGIIVSVLNHNNE
jgi:hypothetical protein